ncbi:TonB-dependent receptor plug domain protein [Verrucomicrobiia bacterium DG1235]|nr:TonB-dependent receptor plug domain protein [Verrucomicrobiae bacterium DG1235]
MIKPIPRKLTKSTGVLIASVVLPAMLVAQNSAGDEEEEVFTLSPFEVTGDSDSGYTTSSTLAGNRLNTEIRDLGTSLSVYTEQFLDDIGATDNQSLLKYTLGTEIGGVNGNFSGSGGGVSPDTGAGLGNPNSNNRVRGLISADNTRDLYLTSVPWDGYNVGGVDIQRGPNAILFGQGSPGGVINTRSKQATWEDSNEIGIRLDEYGSMRFTVDMNKVLIEDQLSVRFAAVDNRTKFKQEPAFDDFQRQYFTARYEPEFLNSGDSRTIFKASVELGDGESNRPRNMPPVDYITPWFSDEVGQETYNVAWVRNDLFNIPGRGDAVPNRSVDGATVENPNYKVPFGSSTQSNGYAGYFGGSIFFFDGDSSDPFYGMALNPISYLGVDINGNRDGGIGGLPSTGPIGVAGYRGFASTTGVPFSTLAKDKFITDTNIFDFYNNLLDGEIKREWMNFDSFDASVSQTFFGDTMGIDIGYHTESYTSGGYNPVGYQINVDMNERWVDGTNTPETGWYTDGTLNQGSGRAFTRLGNGTGESTADRESWRATAFFSHDFAKNGDGNWLTRLLGKHTITGMGSQDVYARESRSWAKSTFVGDYYNHPQFQGIKEDNGRFWADFVPSRVVYLSDNLQSASLGQNLGLRYPTEDPVLGETVNLRYFDSTWNRPTDPTVAGYVDPEAIWYNQVGVGSGDGAWEQREADNPANYVGWVTEEVRLLTDANPANISALTTNRNWDDRDNEAYGGVWQGKFWNDSIVATAGWRHDKVSQMTTKWDRQEAGDDPASVVPTSESFGPVEEESTSYGAVVHLNRLPFVGDIVDRLPVNISASYNESNNFQTGQIYADYFGNQHSLPEGETEDMGVLIGTKDGKFSLKLNKFESRVANQAGSFIQYWNYGNNVGIYANRYHQLKYNYRYGGQPNNGPQYGDGVDPVSGLPVPGDNDPDNYRREFDYAPWTGQTWEEAEALEREVVAAYDDWLEEMYPLPQIMAEAWSFAWDGTDFTETAIENFRMTSDVKAEGYEFEVHAQVTDNWRMTMNASRIKSFRDNIGGSAIPGTDMTLIDYLLDFDRRMAETAMGDLRIWGFGGTATARENWQGHADGDLKARLAEEGTVVPEGRLWHANFVTNYDFSDGKFSGWSVGGSMRYQSAATLAYQPIQGANYIGYDLDAPFKDSSEANIDLWFGYGRQIFNDKVDWRMQVNISNVGVGEELIPVTVQPDGTPAAYRIRPPQQIFLSNTFEF